MRLPRVLAQGEGYYHVISRISGQRFLLNAEEKDRLVCFMNASAGFSGVDVLAYAFMDNHFHMLVKVPMPYDVDDVELIRRMRLLYGQAKLDRILGDWETWEGKGMEFKVLDAKAALRRRMHDLSQFCKTLKETFSMSYNARHGHVGTIWGSRFKSVLLSPDYRTLMTVGSYIDLNPVRAGAVEEASAYRWNGYGTALRGNTLSRNGLCTMVAMAYLKRKVVYDTALTAYESAMQGFIETPAKEEPAATSVRPSLRKKTEKPKEAQTFVSKQVARELAEGGKLSLFAMLRCKVRYFSQGLAVGPAAFVREVIGKLTPTKDTASRCDCCDEIELFTARRLRGDGKVSVPKGRVA